MCAPPQPLVPSTYSSALEIVIRLEHVHSNLLFDSRETCKCCSSGIVCWHIYNDQFSSFPLIWIPDKNNKYLSQNYGPKLNV